MSSRFWRKHKTSAFFGGLVIISLATSAGDIAKNMGNLSAVREQIAANNKNQMKLSQNEEYDKERAEIANARMKRGCILVVDVKSAKNLVTLTEGQVIKDRTTKANLPEGVTVCGGNGETAVIRKNAEGVPVTTDIAVGDRELIYKNLSRVRGAKVYYNVPEQRGNQNEKSE